MVCKLAEIMREKLNTAKALKVQYRLIVLEQNAGRNKHKVKMRKTPGAEESVCLMKGTPGADQGE